MPWHNVVDVAFLLVLSKIFRYQPIRCTDLTEVKKLLFLTFQSILPTACLLVTGSLRWLILGFLATRV